MILDRIIKNKRLEVENSKKSLPLEHLVKGIENLEDTKGFCDSLKHDGSVKVIAEIKCASPSKGVLREDFDHVGISKSYAKNGASAISVLTDTRFFKGSYKHLTDVRNTVDVPLLRKDFIIDPYQVYESRYYGADAILLIVSALDLEILKQLLELARSLNMEAVVEVHDEAELEKAIDAGCRIVGINNRDLKSFDVSLEVSMRLAKLIPEGNIVISESGISSIEDIEKLASVGINVFLIGETFMKAADPGHELKRILLECSSKELIRV